MEILLNKLQLCLSKYSNNDLNELNNRLSNDTLTLMFNSFLKITNNDNSYIIENINNKFNIELINKQKELDETKNNLDILNKTFNTYKENTEINIQTKSNELCNIKTTHLNERIIDIEKYYKNQIINLQNNHNEQIKLYEQQINNINKTNISNETLDSFKEDLIDIINTTPDINNQNANIKGQFGENIINNIKEDYKLCQEFYLEDTTNIESNGDFIAHNIYPNITDKILIESKFVKTICTTKNIKHGKSDLVRFEEHSTKFFKENPNSHSIIFSMNSDKIPSKGFYHIENIDNHYMFYVSINYSKINNLEIFQNIINFIFHTIVMHIVENNQNNNTYDINHNTNILIKLLEKSYHKENNTINILETKISRLQKDIQEYNQLVSEHKNNTREILTTFTKINHNFETTNIVKPLINMSIVHNHMQNNSYNMSYLNDISCKELKELFPELPNKFTKKKLIEDYNTYLNNL